MSYLRHAELHATKRTSLVGLDQNLIFFGPPHTRISVICYGLLTFASRLLHVKGLRRKSAS